MTTTALGAGREFDRIRAIARVLGDRAPDLGNDCALVDLAGATLAVTTDVSVEGVHFRREWLTLEEIGWRATAASLSDLAAAGAEPIGVLAALTIPAGEPEASFAAIMGGCGAAVARGESLALAITSVGRAAHPIRRSGARPGDTVWVTGELGGARAALAAWTAGREPDPDARRRFAHPEPRIAAGRWLAEQPARAMMDLSDGLAGDAGHLAAASGVTLRIALDRLPIHPAVASEARRAGESPPLFAARGGEDYELLAILPADFSGVAAPGIPLTAIGVVEAGAPRAILESGGAPVSLTGYDHFA
jgi:thiamine-monophosphate kinase